MKKKFFVLFIIVILIVAAFAVYFIRRDDVEKVHPINLGNSIKSEAGSIVDKIETIGGSTPVSSNPDSTALPGKKTLEMQFLSQAPFGVWDPLHEDACEEAAVAMVKHYIDKTNISSLEAGDKEIIDMVNYEEKNGYGISISLAELKQIIKDYYGMENVRIEKNVTIESIKKEVAAGRPVIIPAAGNILPNPNFRNGGPVYHMLVVKGYDSKYFITNDPGTRKGEDFKYTFDDLLNAIHDWNPQDIYQGQKAYLVFD